MKLKEGHYPMFNGLQFHFQQHKEMFLFQFHGAECPEFLPTIMLVDLNFMRDITHTITELFVFLFNHQIISILKLKI